MEGHAPGLKSNLKDVRQYIYATVAHCNGLKLSQVSDDTPLNEAAMEVGITLAFRISHSVVINDFSMTIGQLLKELKLK